MGWATTSRSSTRGRFRSRSMKRARKAIADRRRGIGCDQVIVMEPAKGANAFMRIFNADGGEVESCGNAARCVAYLLMAEAEIGEVKIDDHRRTAAVPDRERRPRHGRYGRTEAGLAGDSDGAGGGHRVLRARRAGFPGTRAGERRFGFGRQSALRAVRRGCGSCARRDASAPRSNIIPGFRFARMWNSSSAAGRRRFACGSGNAARASRAPAARAPARPPWRQTCAG